MKSEDELSPRSPSPERPPEVTSAVRRRSSVGIQRQASVCLSDEDDDHVAEESPSSGSTTEPERSTAGTARREVSAVVHHSSHEKPLSSSWDETSVGSSSSQPLRGVRHPPFIHSHSSPDSGSTATVLEVKHGRLPSTISLRGVAADNLARVVDLEDYHYSRQQVWELASQGATLLKERSQSSLDVAVGNDGWEELPSRIQQAASTEAGLLEQGLEHHQLENLRSILSRYSPVDEEEAHVRCKVRYNDTGSREDIREEVIEMISGESEEDSSSSVETEIVKQQYRKLWELRATLEEEEEELSDPQHEPEDLVEDEMVSPGRLDEQELLASQATSFESSVDVSEHPGEDCDEPSGDYLQLPTHELRRRCYKSLLAKRGQRRTANDPRTSGGGGESSFESVESSSTDRTEGATTSFESTTDNTDSTGEGQTNRLQQMKADSGYKSMESNGKAPRLSRKQLQFTLDGDSLDAMLTLEGSLEEEEEEVLFEDAQEKYEAKAKCTTPTAKQLVFKEEILSEVQAPQESEPEVRKYKSALKKHRTESDIKWIEQQTLPEISSEAARGKTSVFQRFFRSGRLRFDTLQLMRDYSIDEKSDALFREFSRPDEAEFYRSRSSRLHGHIRLHHRPLPPAEGGSPRLARKVLSPQLSIEEESCESGEEHQSGAEEEHTAQSGGKDTKSPHETQAQIPVICLTQGKGERPT